MISTEEWRKHIKSQWTKRKIEKKHLNLKSRVKIEWVWKTVRKETCGTVTKELVFVSLKPQKEEKEKGKVGKVLKEIMVEHFQSFASHKCTHSKS